MQRLSPLPKSLKSLLAKSTSLASLSPLLSSRSQEMSTSTNPAPAHYDILILGCGLSGIAAAQKIKKAHPRKTFKVLEKREMMGGTWSLFNYPGFRCDSDMYTFAFSFAPWTKQKRVSSGSEMLTYLQSVITTQDLEPHIVYNCGVESANFNSNNAEWTVKTSSSEYAADHIILGTGYYSYDKPYIPSFPGQETFLENGGEIIHSQNFDPKIHSTSDKNVVLIGSGATAVTIFPALVNADNAPVKTTLLQRSPSYIVAAELYRVPSYLTRLTFKLPILGGAFERLYWKGVKGFEIYMSIYTYSMCKVFPKAVKVQLKDLLEEYSPNTKRLVAEGHFSPTYDVWDQRVCACPDYDFYAALDTNGKGSIYTGDIVEFEEGGILVNDKSATAKGQEVIKADTVILCTGLTLLFAGGIKLSVDDVLVDVDHRVMYKNTMITGIPNFFYLIGYTNASWTLKVELTLGYISRLFTHCDENKFTTITPIIPTDEQRGLKKTAISLNSSYITRPGAAKGQPKSGSVWPWNVVDSWVTDFWGLSVKSIADEGVVFGKGGGKRSV